MKFYLEGFIEFSSSVEFLQQRLPELVAKEINTELLRKGVPAQQEGARLVRWLAVGTKLRVTIEGTTYLRPHDALLRLRTYFSEKLGRKYRIGVRSIGIKKYEIAYKPECMPKQSITVHVPWVQSISKRGNELRIVLKGLDATAIEDRYVENIIKLVEEKIAAATYGGKKERWKLLWQSRRKSPVWKSDPTPEMEKRGWIKRFDAGVWLHMPPSAKIMATMREIAMRELIKPLKFQEVILPKTVPLEVWTRTGHMPGSANSFFYVSRPKKWDPKFWEDLADYVKVTGKVPAELLKEKVEVPTAGICFAQCPPLYWYFAKHKLSERSLPLKFWDASGVSYRWEAGGLRGIERDCEFHRIEIVWLGTKKQVIGIKDELIERYKHIFEDILEIEWRMAWVVPWYVEQAGLATEKAASKEVGTIDFEAWLPWRGSREKSEWLEFQNLTVAGTKFSDAWGYKTEKGNDVWSGCSGIGLDRWLSVFLSQKGLEPEHWPKEFVKRFGKMPKEIELI